MDAFSCGKTHVALDPSLSAELAGLTYEVRVLPRGVRLTFGGYNDKLKRFASFVSRKLSSDIKDLLPKNDQEFDRYKDQIMRALSAFDVKQPYSHASYYAQMCLQPRRFQYSNKGKTERVYCLKVDWACLNCSPLVFA